MRKQVWVGLLEGSPIGPLLEPLGAVVRSNLGSRNMHGFLKLVKVPRPSLLLGGRALVLAANIFLEEAGGKFAGVEELALRREEANSGPFRANAVCTSGL